MSKVAVQIVTYHSAADISACLDAVLAQTYAVAEIVVVDNGSGDETVSVLQTYQEKITLIRNSNNAGFTGAHEQALSYQADVDYVLMLNPDVTLAADFIERIVHVLDADDTIGMATGKLYQSRQSRHLDTTGLVMHRNFRAFDRGMGVYDRGQYDERTAIFGVSGAAAMYRYQMIRDVSVDGLFFDQHFFAYKEDVDVAWRAALFGWRAVFVPDAVGEHPRGWGSQRRRSDIPLFIRRHSYINRYYMLRKQVLVSQLLYHLPFWLSYDLAVLLRLAVSEPRVLGAWRQFFQHGSILRRQRAIIQNKRSVSARELRRRLRLR